MTPPVPPAAHGPLTPAPGDDSRAQAPAASKPTAPILIVDDEPDLRDTLSDILQLEGYATRTAEDGKDALDKLAQERPCLILLDLIMPRMDGNQLYAHLRADPRYASTPVIVSTSDPTRAPPGASVIPKPLDIARLLAAIKDACG